MKPELLKQNELPSWFSYPADFLRTIELGLVDLEPWRILEGDELVNRQLGLKDRYPERELMVFARRDDCDDVACWEMGVEGVVIVHDYASAGWESSEGFKTYWDWFRSAIEDMIEHD